jgi:hypothetical protein
MSQGIRGPYHSHSLPPVIHHVLVALAILTRLVYLEFHQKEPKIMFAPPAKPP